MSSGSIVLYPIMTEDAVNLIEKENKIIFMVDIASTKSTIKAAVEKMYEVKVDRVNVLVTIDGQKKAFVKLKPESNAADLAVKLGIF